MSNRRQDSRMKKFEKSLRKDLVTKAVFMPVAFGIITVIVCLLLSNPALNIFPNKSDEANDYSATAQIIASVEVK